MAVENTINIAGLDDSLPTGTDTKSEGDNHLRLLKTVLKHVFAGFPGEVLLAAAEAQGATVNDYVLTVAPAPSAYATSTMVVFRANHANTGAATLKIGGLAARSLLNPEGTPLRANAITSTTWVVVAYDGTNFRMVGGGNSQAIYDYADQLAFQSSLPNQAGNAGRFLQTDGGNASWKDAMPVIDSGSVPTSDKGPIYVPGTGGMIWDGTKYKADTANGVIPAALKNLVRNPQFLVLQRPFSGTITLTAGQYGHDCWKAGAAGCTYSWVKSAGKVTVTIAAGTLVQDIEGADLRGDTYTFSWGGTAQARINGGGYGVSGIQAVLAGGANVTIEFSAGTLEDVQLERGANATSIEVRPYDGELVLCRRYLHYFRIAAGDWMPAFVPSGGGIRLTLNRWPDMRIPVPASGVDVNNWQAYVGGTWVDIAVASSAAQSCGLLVVVFSPPSGAPASGTVLVRNTAGANAFVSAEL